MRYWLMKSEPDTYSINDLAKHRKQTDHWEGVRNYQARNMLRDEMHVGDHAFFYHSSCAEPAIVGMVKIVRAGYPDPTQFDPESKYYDPKSTEEKPIWYTVCIINLGKLEEASFLDALMSAKFEYFCDF